jgi:hypothetical protein
MVFVPIADLYNLSPEFHTKLQFNHEKYIGDETPFSIGSFQNLNNLVPLKNGTSISIRMLLKSIPASEGMSRPQLFQQTEPNHGATVTIVTFQASDKDFVMALQETLEEEICNVLAPDQEQKIFLNEFDGIWFGGVNKTKKGLQYSSLKNKTKDDVDYSAHINSIMNSKTGFKSSQLEGGGQHTSTTPSTTAHIPVVPASTQKPPPSDLNKNFELLYAEIDNQRDCNAQFDQHIVPY